MQVDSFAINRFCDFPRNHVTLSSADMAAKICNELCIDQKEAMFRLNTKTILVIK